MKKSILIIILMFSAIILYGQCNYTLELNDSYGDSWNGNTIDVIINSSTTNYTLNDPPGDTVSYPLAVTTGDTISLDYLNGGSYNSEVSFRLLDSTGSQVYASGTDPFTGVHYTGTATCPACLPPTNQIENTITISSAVLIWTAGGSEALWNLEYGPASFTQGTGTLLSGLTSTTYLLTGLDDATGYDWYVQADCVTDSSSWTGPSRFYTLYDGIQIGSGTTTNQSLPIEPYFGYSYSQSIYLDSDFGTPGASKQISKIWYNYSWNGGDEDSDTWVIYMGITDSTSIASTTAWFPVAGLSEVFNGDVNLELVSGIGWIEIVLDSPFNYNPAIDGNLIIAVDENEPAYTSPSDEFFCDLDTRANVSIEYHNDNTNPDPTSPPEGTLKAYYPNTRFEFQDIPSCPTPFALGTSSITDDGADLSWTEAGTATLWDIEIVLAGTAFSGVPDYTDVTNPYSVTGLLANTSYDWKVRADCGVVGGTSTWSSLNNFKTECAAAALPISENFDAVTPPALPDCWKTIDDTGNSYSYVKTSTSVPHSGSNSLAMYNSGAITGNLMLISPESSDTAAGTWVRFWARSSSGDQSIDVGTMTDPTNAGTFTLMDSVAINATYAEYSVMLSGTDNYVVVKHAMDGTYDYNYLDDIIWEEVPACFNPSGLVTTNVTTTEADLAWVEMNIPAATLWNVEWDTLNFVQGTGNMVTGVADTTLALSGLTSATAYEWYVQADCGTRATSSWSGPISFNTLIVNDSCSAAVAIGNVTDQPFDNTSATTSGFNGNPHSINKDMFYVYTAAASGYLDVDLCLDPDVGGFDTKLAIYDDCVPTTELGYDDDGCPTITRSAKSQLLDIPVVSGEDYIIQVGAFSSYFGTGDITISLDTCVPADSVVTENILQNTADLVWYNHGQATTYEVIIDTAGFAFDVNASPTYSGVSSPYGVINLLAGTDYEWYIMPTCGDTLDWVGPIAFTTLEDCPFPSVLTSTNVGPDQADLGWTENGTALSWQIEIDTTGATFSGAPDYTVGTNPYTVTGLSNEQSYQWYVRADCGGGTYSTWAGPSSFTTLVAYPAPTSPTTTNILPTSADLDWVNGWDESYWNVEYDTTNFVLGTGIAGNATSHPYGISSLLPNTTYDWYVRANYNPLAPGQESAWVGPITFTTLCATITPDYTEDFTTFLPDCWVEGDGPVTGPTTYGSSSWSADDWLNTPTNGAAKINLYYNNHEEWLLSPLIDLSAGGYEVTCDVAVTVWNGTAAINMGSDDQVQLLITTDGGTTWTNLHTWNVSNNPSNLGTYTAVDITSYTSSTAQFAFWGADGPIDDTEDYDFFVDNFRVQTKPACPPPTALYTDAITDLTANLNWTAGGIEPNWNIEWGAVGFVQGTGTMINNTTSNPYTLTGLSPVTPYDWYVQADCDGASRDESAWVGPSTFSTTGSYPLPYSQDFATWLPTGWTTEGGTNWKQGLGNSAGGIAPEALFYWSPGTTATQRLISPPIDTYGETHINVEFRHYLDNYGGDLTIMLQTTSDGVNWNTTSFNLVNPVGNVGPEFQSIMVDNADVGSENFQCAFVFDGNSYNLDNWYVDDVEVIVSPPPTLAITPSPYDFGNVPVGGILSNIFTLSNTGIGTVTVNSVADITLTGDAAFSIASIYVPGGYPVTLPSDTLTVEVQLVSAAAVSYSTSLDVTWGTARDVTSAVITAEGCPAVANDDCSTPTAINGPYPTPLGSGSNECTLIDCPGYLDWFTVWYEIDLPYAMQDIYITQCGNGVDMASIGVILMDDCACDDYILYTSAAWGDSCGTGFTGAEVFYNDVTGPRTLLWPAYAIDALDNNVAFNYTVDIESVDFTPPAPTGVGIAVDSGTNTATVSWDYVAGLKYTVYSDTDPYGSFTTVVGTDITVGFLDITPIPAANTFYRVTADVVLVRGVNPVQTYTDPTLNRLTEKAPKVIIGTTKIGTSEKAKGSSRTKK